MYLFAVCPIIVYLTSYFPRFVNAKLNVQLILRMMLPNLKRITYEQSKGIKSFCNDIAVCLRFKMQCTQLEITANQDYNEWLDDTYHELIYHVNLKATICAEWKYILDIISKPWHPCIIFSILDSFAWFS